MKRFLLFPLAALLLAFAAPARAEGGLVTECTFVVPAGLSLVSVPFVKLDGSAFAFGETAFATNLPVGSTVLFWNAENRVYSSGERYDDGWEPDVTDHVLATGEAFWVRNQTGQDIAITVAGTPPSADTLSVPYLGNGALNLLAFPYPAPVKFADTGLASQLPAGSTVRFWNAKNSSYFSGERYDDGWEPAVSNYVLAVGEGFWIQSTSANNSEIWKAVRPRPAPPSIVGIEISTASQTPSLMSFTIAFSANGGTGTMAPQTIARDSSATLPPNAFTRAGHFFAGWATSSNGAVAYADRATVRNLVAAGAAITLYARWTKNTATPPPPVAPPAVSTYKVAFNANGGKGKMATLSMTYGKAKKLSANKFTRSGYKFAGWAKSKALAKKGKVAYKNKKSVKNLTTTGKTVKLYAVWKKK